MKSRVLFFFFFFFCRFVFALKFLSRSFKNEKEPSIISSSSYDQRDFILRGTFFVFIEFLFIF